MKVCLIIIVKFHFFYYFFIHARIMIILVEFLLTFIEVVPGVRNWHPIGQKDYQTKSKNELCALHAEQQMVRN